MSEVRRSEVDKAEGVNLDSFKVYPGPTVLIMIVIL